MKMEAPPLPEPGVMRKALEQIIANQCGACERYTTGIGSCFVNGNTTDAPYYSERCCAACIAHSALLMARFTEPTQQP